VILVGITYMPNLGPSPSYTQYDCRCHSGKQHTHEQISSDTSGTELMWFDVTTFTKPRSWQPPNQGGLRDPVRRSQPTRGGRFVALNNNTASSGSIRTRGRPAVTPLTDVIKESSVKHASTLISTAGVGAGEPIF
jgi:hypothetical protein